MTRRSYAVIGALTTALLALAASPVQGFELFPLERVSLRETTIQFDVTGDRPIKHAYVSAECLRSATFMEQLNNGLDEFEDCRRLSYSPEGDTYYRKLEALGDNRFHFDALDVAFSKRRKGTFCIRFHVELENEHEDPPLYADTDDAYSVVTFCTRKKLPSHWRVHKYTWVNRQPIERFDEVLSKPLKIKLLNPNSMEPWKALLGGFLPNH